MRIASTIGAHEVSHDGETYTADDDGILDVPQEVGEELLTFPHFLPEYEALDAAAAERAANDSDVTRLAARVASLEEQLAEALDRLAALEAAEKPLTAVQKKAAEKAAEAENK